MNYYNWISKPRYPSVAGIARRQADAARAALQRKEARDAAATAMYAAVTPRVRRRM